MVKGGSNISHTTRIQESTLTLYRRNMSKLFAIIAISRRYNALISHNTVDYICKEEAIKVLCPWNSCSSYNEMDLGSYER
jgi:hypothetical protein